MIEAGIPPLPLREFRARFPWYGGDLQTLRNMVVRSHPSFGDAPGERTIFPMADGTGDALIGTWHRPGAPESSTLVVLVHGLTGCADSFYVLATARHLLDRGFAVLRLNLRGAGASAGQCAEQYHAGRSADLRTVIASLARDHGAERIFAVGYSLGGNLLLKLLGEDGAATPLAGAASVSAPLDLAAAAARMRRLRNRIYENYLLRRMKTEVLASRGGFAGGLADAARAASTIVEFDDTVIAPRYGFASAVDYYARCSSAGFLPSVAVPTLLIHAENDPWIPADAYRAISWRALPKLTPLTAAGGGHVGFHGEGSRVAWHDRAIAAYIGACL